jgi:hypothetical protein
MYEDLIRTQQPSALERFVLTSLLPSLLVTSLLRANTFWADPHRETIAKVNGEYVVTRAAPGPYFGLSRRRYVDCADCTGVCDCAGTLVDLRISGAGRVPSGPMIQ